MLIYPATIFISAFLLFQIQPLISKYILPWFGGSTAVWTVCILFFQLLLVAGYAYAHVIIRFLSRRSQFIIHALLIASALLFLPVIPAETWKPEGIENPTFHILLLLAVDFQYRATAVGGDHFHAFRTGFVDRKHMALTIDQYDGLVREQCLHLDFIDRVYVCGKTYQQ